MQRSDTLAVTAGSTMTIHPDWAKAVKMRYPHCFSATLPSGPTCPPCGIIDGHIQLMGAYHVSSWEQFLQSQFVRPISQLFAQGCSTVVLLFDNRNAVSPYKGMTQYKRCKRYQDVQFTQSDPLPQNVPSPWIDHMMNRHFKDKVISLVCERVQALTQPSRERVLIVDFKGPPKMYNHPTACPTDIDSLCEMGESDVKFTRYVEMLGNSIVYATDGDYIAISLLYYSVHGTNPQNQIFIYRQLANIGDGDPPARRGCPRGGAAAAGRRGGGAAAQKPKRRMEYIHMQPVFMAAMDIMRCPMETPPQQAMIAFVSTMLLAGTDYSRGIPLVGPKRIVDIIPDVARHMLSVVTDENGVASPRPSLMADRLTVQIYRAAFEKQLKHLPRPKDIRTALQGLQSSELSQRSKALLPSAEQVHTTCRNVCWVVHYWKDCINSTPDLSQELMYWFVYDPSNRQYTWSDLAAKPAPLDAQHESEMAVDSAEGGAANGTMLFLMDPTTNATPLPQQMEALRKAAQTISENR